MISEHTRKLLIASKVKGVGKRALQYLAHHSQFFELAEECWHLEFPKLASFFPSSPEFSNALAITDSDIRCAERQGVTILSVRDPAYPKLLRDLKDSPTILYVQGDPSRFTEKALAVVGTREPTLHGKIVAERITKYFAEKGWQVVSGLAVGVDTVAHEATLSVLGSTVAVLAHGLDIAIYPKQNSSLAKRIVENGGLLISEYPFGTSSFPAHFVERDRIQAALAKGVVMVQSGETGGSWHASRAALNYDRWLMVPEPTSRDRLEGNPKIRGNKVMADGTVSAKVEILKCSSVALEKLMILRTREDYPLAEERLLQ